MASEAGQAWSCVAFGSVSFRALPNLSLASATESRPYLSLPGCALFHVGSRRVAPPQSGVKADCGLFEIVEFYLHRPDF